MKLNRHDRRTLAKLNGLEKIPSAYNLINKKKKDDK